MNGPWKFLFAVMLVTLATAFSNASDIYIAQNATGGNTGADCADAHAASWFNSSSNWGNGGIGPGTTAHLCGTISTELTAQGSGMATAPITILFEAGAKISLPTCDNNNGCLNISRLSWIIVDGGTPCGPGTSCDQSDSGTGIIENTANGTNLANHVDAVGIMMNGPSCSNCEIRNLILRNFYVYVPNSHDPHNFGVTGAFFAGGVSGSAFLKIHDLVCHDVRACFSYNPVANDSGTQVYNFDFYNADGINVENNSGSTPIASLSIHDGHFHDIANWDDAGCPYHHDGIHSWALTGGTSSNEQVYNNLFDGNFGTCPTGAIFFEGSHSNASLYNNIFLTTYTQENNGIFNVNGTGYQVYDNTIVGANRSGDLCFNIGNPGGTASITFENNIVTGCNTLILTQNNPATKAWDYNVYGGCAPTGCNSDTPFVANGGSFDSYPTWQSSCSCDTHSAYGSSTSFAGLSSAGQPQSGSPAINWGANLTTVGITALESDTSDGDTISPVARPAGVCTVQGQSASCWTIGAFNYGSGSSAPSPPTNLQASVN